MKNETKTRTFGVVCLFLCCYFMQLLNLPNALTVLAGGALFLVLVFLQKKIKIDGGICLIAVTMVSYYAITNGARGLLFTILYIPPMLYLLAGSAVEKEEKNWEKRAFRLIFALVIGYAVHGILNACMFYGGYVIPGTRQWQDFWTGAIVPGTQHTAYFLPALAMFFPAVMYFRKRVSLNVLLIAAAVFFGYTSLATKSRMSVVIFALVFFAQILLYVVLEKEKTKKIVSDKRFQWGCLFFLLAFAAGVFLIKDSDVVVAFVENMGKGGGILNNVRFQAQHQALLQLFDFPLGGRQMELGRTYCHNTWLDMANAAGLIPFFAFTAFTIYTGYRLIRLILDKEVSSELKIMLSGLYLSFFLFFTVEPALDASIHLFAPWIYVGGLIYGIQSGKQKNKLD